MDAYRHLLRAHDRRADLDRSAVRESASSRRAFPRRGRIAGGLHDVLGEALSKITLKAQLRAAYSASGAIAIARETKWPLPSEICRDALRGRAADHSQIPRRVASGTGTRDTGARRCCRVRRAARRPVQLHWGGDCGETRRWCWCALAALLEMEGDIEVIAQASQRARGCATSSIPLSRMF